MRATLGVFVMILVMNGVADAADFKTVDEFKRPNSYYHGHGWETLNPGYWKNRKAVPSTPVEERR